jgi:hypothetical protein
MRVRPSTTKVAGASVLADIPIGLARTAKLKITRNQQKYQETLIFLMLILRELAVAGDISSPREIDQW